MIRSEVGFNEVIINDSLKLLCDNSINTLAKVTLKVLSVFSIQVSCWVSISETLRLLSRMQFFVTRILKDAISLLTTKDAFLQKFG